MKINTLSGLGCCALLAGLLLSAQAETTVTIKALTGSADDALVSNMVSMVDRHIQSSTEILKGLVGLDAVQSGDWEQINATLLSIQPKMSSTVLWFGYPDGSYAVAGKGMTKMNVRDRAYFAAAMAGKVSVGELVISRTSGKKSCIIAVPVLRDGKVMGFIGASLYLEDLSKYLQDQLKLSPTKDFFAVDRDGQITLAKTPSRIFSFMYEGAGEDVASALDQILTKDQGVAELQGKNQIRRLAFGSCKVVNWKVLITDVPQP